MEEEGHSRPIASSVISKPVIRGGRGGGRGRGGERRGEEGGGGGGGGAGSR